MNRRILSAPLYFSEHFSTEAKSLLRGLLQRNPKLRLGSGKDDGREIMAHPFFRSIDWARLARKEIEPAFKPHLVRFIASLIALAGCRKKERKKEREEGQTDQRVIATCSKAPRTSDTLIRSSRRRRRQTATSRRRSEKRIKTSLRASVMSQILSIRCFDNEDVSTATPAPVLRPPSRSMTTLPLLLLLPLQIHLLSSLNPPPPPPRRPTPLPLLQRVFRF